MSGLQRVLKLFGEMKAVDAKGNRTDWVWDYARDEATTREEMPLGSQRDTESERAKWTGRKP